METKESEAIEAAPEDVPRQIATVLIEGFDKHYRIFRAASARAREQFDAGAWTELQHAVQERIRYYDERVLECVDRLRSAFDVEALADETWRDAKLFYIGLLVEHSQPELAETFFNSVIKRILQRSYYDNDLVFVRAAISTEYIEPDPPIYRSYYPNVDGERRVLRAALPRLRLEPAVRRSRPRSRPRVASCTRGAPGRTVDAPRAELPDPGAELRPLPEQGRIRVRQARQRPRGASVRRPGPARRGRPARAGHDPARPTADPRPLLALARLFHGGHGGAVRLRRVPPLDGAGSRAFRALHDDRARQAGKDALLPRAVASPAPFTGRVRRGARNPRAGDARLHAAVVSVRLQGDPRRRSGAPRTPTARPSARSSPW